MRAPHRSALWASVGPLALVLVGCGPEPAEDEVVEVAVHLPAGCDGPAGQLDVALEALGDFAASPLTSESLPEDGRALPLRFPEGTRAVTASAAGGAGRWLGMAEIRAPRTDVLLLPESEACTLYAGSSYPLSTGGEALAASLDGGLALVAGALVDSSDAANAAFVDLFAGTAGEAVGGLLPGRAFATITPLGTDALLMAGGVDPAGSGGDLSLSPPVDTAIVFEIAERRFDRESLVQLARRRARHGAVRLVDGSVLLVGGIGATGLPLSSLEVISPIDRTTRINNLATLRARSGPTVLRLDDGRVFVGGGRNAVGDPEPVVEWLSADASEATSRTGLVIAPEHAFAAMPGGGVLGLGVCDPSKSISCAPAPERELVWFRADGTLDPLEPLAFAPDAPLLVAGADAAPWLVSGAGAARQWRRFEPWSRRFVTVPQAPDETPAPGLPAVAPDPGSLVFLAAIGGSRASVVGFRHEQRGAYARDVAPLLLAGPDHMAPTRAPLGTEQTGIDYGAQGLEVRSGAEARVTGTSYERVQLVLDWQAGPAPRVILRSDTNSVVVGADGCPWPAADAPAQLELRRQGGALTLTGANQTATCVGVSGRVSIAVSGTSATDSTRLRSLSVQR